MDLTAFTVDTTTSHQRAEIHCDLYTATIWTLHFRVDPPATVEALADLLLSTGAEFLTGEYIGGDSFREWCEEYEEGVNMMGDFDRAEFSRSYGRALHLDIGADDLPTAIARARVLIMSAIGRGADERYQDSHYVTLSTGGDWAEQSEVW
jgi:hypothetical protein